MPRIQKIPGERSITGRGRVGHTNVGSEWCKSVGLGEMKTSEMVGVLGTQKRGQDQVMGELECF